MSNNPVSVIVGSILDVPWLVKELQHLGLGKRVLPSEPVGLVDLGVPLKVRSSVGAQQLRQGRHLVILFEVMRFGPFQDFGQSFIVFHPEFDFYFSVQFTIRSLDLTQSMVNFDVFRRDL